MIEDLKPDELSEAFIRAFARRIQTFRDACTPENRERGRQIFEAGGVRLTRFDEASAAAEVTESGSEPFSAAISFRGNSWASRCSCGDWGNRDDHCRHVAALVRFVEQMKNEATGCAPFIGLPPDLEELTLQEAEAREAAIREERRRVIAMNSAEDWLGLSSEGCHSFRYDIDLVNDTQLPEAVFSKSARNKTPRLLLRVGITKVSGSSAPAGKEPRRIQVTPYLKGHRISLTDRKAFALIDNGRRTECDEYLFDAAAAGPVLQSLSSSYLRYRSRPVDFSAETVRIAADLGTSETGTDRTVSLCLMVSGGRIALSAVEFISEFPVFALYDGTIYRVATEASLSQIRRWQAQPTLCIPSGDDDSWEKASGALTALGVWFGENADSAKSDVPQFILSLSGNAEAASAHLAVRYGAAEFPLFRAGQRTHITSDGHLIRRDVQAEQSAIDALKFAGLTREAQHFAARGDRAIEFWAKGVHTLPPDWIFFGAKPREVVRIRTLAPQVAVSLSRNSWFDLDIQFVTSDATVDLAAVRSQILTGRRYVRLRDGSMGELPKALSEHIRRILEETGKTPDGSSLSLEPYEAPEVEKLLAEVPDAQEAAGAFRQLEILGGRLSVEKTALPAGFVGKMRPYQQAGFDWLVFLYRMGLGGVLADDMGLGKTIQALALLAWAKENAAPGGAAANRNAGEKLPHLIVAPTSVLTNWQREAARFTPNLTRLVYEGQNREELLGKIEKADLVFTSYALLRRDSGQLRRQKFDCVILDEAQHVKNPASRGAKAIAELQSRRRFALTGTPIENQLSDLWSIFHLLMPGFLRSEAVFRNTFARPIEADGNVDVRARLKRRIAPFVLRRLKADVATDLPRRTDTVIPVELSPGQQALYRDMATTARTRVEAAIDRFGMGRARISILSELLRLRQVCNDPKLLKLPPGVQLPPSAKLDAFAELVRDLIDEGHKALVFSQFTEMLSILVEWAEASGIAYEYLDGETHNRQAHIDRFNAPDGPPLFFISLKAGGTGLNLTQADYVIIYDPWWNPAVEEQAINRAHRIGQDKPVFSYRLITQGTVEQKIVAMQERKKRLAQGVVTSDSALGEDDEAFGKQLSADDLKELFADDFS